MLKKPKKHSGYISVELGFGFGVVTLLAIGGFLIGQDLSKSSRVDQAVTDHTIITRNIEALKRSGVHLPNLDAGQKDSSIFPKTMEKQGTNPATYEHKLKGRVKTLGEGNRFTLYYKNIPANACLEFASRIANMHKPYGSDTSNVLVGATNITTLSGSDNFEKQLSEACTPEVVDIYVEYGPNQTNES